MSEWPHGKNAQEGIDVALENHPKSSDWKVWKQRAKIVAPQRVLRGTPPSCQGWLCAESGKSNVKLQSQIAYWKGKDRTAKSSLVVGSNFNHTRNRIETWWPSQDKHEIQKKKKNTSTTVKNLGSNPGSLPAFHCSWAGKKLQNRPALHGSLESWHPKVWYKIHQNTRDDQCFGLKPVTQFFSHVFWLKDSSSLIWFVATSEPEGTFFMVW